MHEDLMERWTIVMRCKVCAPIIEKKLLFTCVECGDEWVEEDYEMSLVGNDGVALFPNIQSK